MKNKFFNGLSFVLVVSSVLFAGCAFSVNGSHGSSGSNGSNGSNRMITHSVSFYDDEDLVTTQNVAAGSRAQAAAAPEKDGYIFRGWYESGDLFDFTTPIYSDVILSARYVSKTLPVSQPSASLSFTASDLSDYEDMRGKFKFTVNWGNGIKHQARIKYGEYEIKPEYANSASNAIVEIETAVLEINAQDRLTISFWWYNTQSCAWEWSDRKKITKVEFIPEE